MKLELLTGWVCVSSAIAFILFGFDKFRAVRSSGNRVSEFRLLAIGALGGWPGGLAGMLVFRHKTAKLSFKIKYGLCFIIWAALVFTVWGRFA